MKKFTIFLVASSWSAFRLIPCDLISLIFPGDFPFNIAIKRSKEPGTVPVFKKLELDSSNFAFLAYKNCINLLRP
jgi:hypothetical protein